MGSGGSGKKRTVGYKYYLGAHMALCHGPIDKLTAIYVDDKEAWTGESTGGAITVDKPSLFGGEAREGGVSGTVDFEQGGPAQTVNSYLSGKVGSFTPSFRGIAAAVLRQVYIGLNPYLKKWAFRAQRIHTRTAEGLAQWQDDLAEINDAEAGDWEASVSVLDGSTIQCLAYGGGTWIVGGSGKVNRSSDDAATWAGAQAVLGGQAVNGAAYGNNTWVIGGGSGRTSRSTDSGANWSAHVVALGGSNVQAVTYVSGTVFICGGLLGRVSRSSDGGVSWDAHQTILSSVAVRALTTVNGTTIADGNGRVSRSADGGTTWEATQNLLDGQVSNSVAYGAGTWIIAGGAGRINRSFDDGVTWQATQTILGGVTIQEMLYANGVWMAVGNSGNQSYSTDGGANWSTPQNILSTQPANELAFVNGVWFAGGNNGRATRSFDDGVTWEASQQYLSNTNITRMRSSPTAVVAAATTLVMSAHLINPTRIDMNPIHIIRECLTDPDWGMGYPEADIDETSFAAAAQTLFDEDFGLSILWATETTIESFISNIIQHIDAALFVDRTDGKFHIKLIRNDYNVGTIPELNTTNVLRVDNFSRPVFDELGNTVIVKFYDRERRTDSSVSINNIALVQTQGRVISETLSFPGVCYNALAQRIALRELKALSHPLATCVIYANREASTLNPGDVFKLNHSDVSATAIVMRVLKIAYGDGKSTRVKIECAEDVFSLSSNALIGTGVSSWTDPRTPPTPATNRLATEVPYYELVQNLGQTNADNQLSLNEFAGFAFAVAANPGNAVNATLSVDAGAGYEDVAVIDFCPFAQLNGAITKTSTTFPIDSGIDLSEVRIGTFCQIDSELMRVDVITSTSITVGRGVLDTVPATHADNAKIFFWDDYTQGGDETEYGSGTTINLKIRPVNGAGEVALADATADPITFNQRAVRPYAPGLYRINAAQYPAQLIGVDVTLSWAHRDRLQQTSGTIIDQESGNIGPEAGTTYTATLYNNVGGGTLEQFTGVSGTSQAFTSLYGYFNVRAEVFSVRDGLNSWQTHSHIFDHWNHILLTEAGDYLMSEADDYLIEE